MENNLKKTERPLMRDCHCFNLRRATLAVTALYDKHMEDADITIQQFSVLRHIHDNSSLSVTELSILMGLDRTTLSRNLALLENRGLLLTQSHHGRKRIIALTNEGEKTLKRAFIHWEMAQKEIEKRLGAERMEQLEELLNALLTEN